MDAYAINTQIWISGLGPRFQRQVQKLLLNLSFDVPKAIYIQIQAPPPSLLLPQGSVPGTATPSTCHHTRVLGVTPPSPPLIPSCSQSPNLVLSPPPATATISHLDSSLPHIHPAPPPSSPAAQSAFKPEIGSDHFPAQALSVAPRDLWVRPPILSVAHKAELLWPLPLVYGKMNAPCFSLP